MTLGSHLLGRVAPPDQNHLASYELIAASPPQGIEVDIKRPTLDQYDQGNTPRCVAYSTSRVMNFFNKMAFDADWLYARCKLVDGMPSVDGTNARAACDVLRAQGHWRKIGGKDVAAGPRRQHGIAANHWATTVDGIRSVFAGTPQPVLIGIDWYDAWFAPTLIPRAGKLEAYLQGTSFAGPIVGGHEIGIWACSDSRQAFGLSNTWGKSWPDLAWLPYSTMTQLFAQGADACVIEDLATR